MTENDSLMNDVKLEIQALLCTEKEAIPSSRLYGLYKSEMGTPVPYAKLGFQRMDDFLRSIPDVVSSYTNYTDGILYVKAVPLEGSAHINELVQGQRAAKKKKPNSNYSMGNRFKSFRVSSQIAPNRNFNRNYNTYKPPERLDNSRNGGFTRQTFYVGNNNHYSLPPRFVKLNEQAPPPPASQLQKFNYFSPSIYSQRATTITTAPTMFSSNLNINTTKMFTKPAMIEPKPVAVLVGSNLNTTGASNSQGVPGRAHLIPQLMQPRTPAPQVQSDTATPPVATETLVVLPTPQAIEKSSALIDPVQNSLTDLKISSSKPVDPINPLEQDSKIQMQHLPKPLSPTKVCLEKSTFPNVSQWAPVAPKPVQEAVKPAPTFYPSGFIQRRAAPRQVVVKPEEERPRKPEVVAEPIKSTPQVPEMIKKEDADDSSAPKINPLARAPRVLLKNAVPVVSPPSPTPLQTPRPFMFLPDHLPPVAPSPTPPVSPFLTRRLPFQSVESESVVKDYTSRLPSIVKPTAVLSTRSDEFYCERLKKMVAKHNLGRVTLSHNQMKSGRFIASIKVGQEMFMTYPEDFEIMTDAYENAAKQAVEHFESTPVWMLPA